MKCHLDCIPCFIRQALQAARFVSDDPAMHEKVVREVLQRAAGMDYNDPPPLMATQIQRSIRELTDCADPYLGVKQYFNRRIMEMLDDFRDKINRSDEPFETAVRLAIAGNIIDFGPTVGVDDAMVLDAVKRALIASIPSESMQLMRDEIEKAEKILYLADNAGEIVFDRLLIEQMPRKKITLAVKGGPIINDALREDAESVGLVEIVEVIDNGCDAPGTVLAACSSDFRSRFEAADLIISKGQANFETLSDVDAKIIFLLTAKCPVVAGEIGCKMGDMLVCPGKGFRVDEESSSKVA